MSEADEASEAAGERPRVGIIAGTGFYELPGLSEGAQHHGGVRLRLGSTLRR